MVYIIETFGRPQAALVHLDEYRRFQQYRQEREAFFGKLNEAADSNAPQNADLNEADLLALIEQARQPTAHER